MALTHTDEQLQNVKNLEKGKLYHFYLSDEGLVRQITAKFHSARPPGELGLGWAVMLYPKEITDFKSIDALHNIYIVQVRLIDRIEDAEQSK